MARKQRWSVPLHIGRPEALYVALLCAVVYWAIRFYQYQREHYKSAYHAATWDLVVEYLRPHALDHIVPERPRFDPPSTTHDDMQDHGNMLELRPHHFNLYNYGWRRLPGSVNPAWFIYKWADRDKPQIVNTQEYNVLFTGPIVFKAMARAHLIASFRTPVFTEHVLPYLLFAVAMTFGVLRLIVE